MSQAVSLEELLATLQRSADELQESLDLNQPLSEPHELVGKTVGEAMVTFSSYEASHAGQLTFYDVWSIRPRRVPEPLDGRECPGTRTTSER